MQSGAYSFFIVKEIVKDRHDIKGNERKHIEELGENKMKKFVFVSDFDGTLTEKDFYQMIIEDRLGEMGKALFDAWKRKEYKDRDFLSKIYKAVDMDESELIEYILTIKWDKYATHLIERVQQSGGEFVILSAGCSYYIDPILRKQNLKHIKVYSNPGVYHNRGIELKIDKDSPYFSDVYGIDKQKVICDLKNQFDQVYFAGDSAPDTLPSQMADIAFAKGCLQEILEKENTPFIAVDHFKDIEDYLIQERILATQSL